MENLVIISTILSNGMIFLTGAILLFDRLNKDKTTVLEIEKSNRSLGKYRKTLVVIANISLVTSILELFFMGIVAYNYAGVTITVELGIIGSFLVANPLCYIYFYVLFWFFFKFKE